MNTSPAIIFMGTPEFAVPSLAALHAAGFSVELVVTQPDRPKGRGRRIALSPVKQAAQAMGMDLFQPTGLRSSDVIERLRQSRPDFIVVVAYGQILPPAVLQMPASGPINLHASLLPKYRGPAPIQWAIMRGETITGVTTMLMDRGVDTGDILLTRQCPIDPHDTADSLHHKLADLGAGLLVETLQLIRQGRMTPQPQDHSQATFAPMLKKEDGRIDWKLSAEQLDALVRAMTSWPGAFCFLGDRRFKIIDAQPLPVACDAPPGTVVAGYPGELNIATGRGLLSIHRIQGSSGKLLSIDDFLCGHRIEAGMVFT